VQSDGNPDWQSLVSEYGIFRGDLAQILFDLTKGNENTAKPRYTVTISILPLFINDIPRYRYTKAESAKKKNSPQPGQISRLAKSMTLSM
jgi:hypothetical protein